MIPLETLFLRSLTIRSADALQAEENVVFPLSGCKVS